MASELIPPAYEERTRYRQIEAELKAIYDTEFKNSNTPERDLHLYDECITLAGQLPEVDQKRHAGTLAKPMQIHGLTKQDILKDIQTKAELKKNPKQKQLSVEDKATALYELVLPGVKLARDIATGETYVSVLTVGVDRPSPWTSTHSKAFQSYLNDAAYGEFRWIVRPDILRTVILKLDGDKAEAVSLSRLVAQYRGPRDKPDRKDAICYDLANEKGEAVKVSPGTWDVVTLDTPLFKRPGITLPPQITPRGDIDDIKRLSELLSIPDTKDEVLSLAWIVSAFVPSLNRPIMNLCGTYARRRARTISQLVEPSVFDPSRDCEHIAVYTQPKNIEQAEHQISNRHLVVYDTNRISGWFADILSSTFYGEQTPKRKLHTDNESYTQYLNGPVILSSLHHSGLYYTDLQDKLMPIRCDDPTLILPEAEYWTTYRDLASSILGGIFSVLSEALLHVAEVELTNPDPLLGDFERWGIAISEALEYQSGMFLEAFTENRETVSYQVIEADPVARCLLAILSTSNEWTGTPSELGKELRKVAIPLEIDTNDRLFPRSPEQVTKRLNELRADLSRLGVSYAWDSQKIKNPATRSGRTTKKVISLRR